MEWNKYVKRGESKGEQKEAGERRRLVEGHERGKGTRREGGQVISCSNKMPNTFGVNRSPLV